MELKAGFSTYVSALEREEEKLAQTSTQGSAPAPSPAADVQPSQGSVWSKIRQTKPQSICAGTSTHCTNVVNIVKRYPST